MASPTELLWPTLEPPPTPEAPPRRGVDDRQLTILGVTITDVTRRRAVELLEDMIVEPQGHTRSVYLVNSHTLNRAAADRKYRRVLRAADYVFGDGTGVRWASRLQGRPVQDNLVGTDLIPALFRATADRGYCYFLLGGDDRSIRRAADYAERTFPGWIQVGYHHGYLTNQDLTASAIADINESGADALLVGMGNPLQERWIHDHQHELDVPLCIAVGGLFNYWAGDLRRAPRWLRRAGWEWLGILLQQPHKAGRYLLGNPLFLARIAREHWRRTRAP